MKKNLPHCNFRIAFQTKYKLINVFAFKDRIPVFLRSGIVYKFKLGGCNATYYCKTKHHFKVRVCEHLGVSALTGKRVKGDKESAIKKHHLFCNHSSCLYFQMHHIFILASKRDYPSMNKNRHSLPLELFND